MLERIKDQETSISSVSRILQPPPKAIQSGLPNTHPTSLTENQTVNKAKDKAPKDSILKQLQTAGGVILGATFSATGGGNITFNCNCDVDIDFQFITFCMQLFNQTL